MITTVVLHGRLKKFGRRCTLAASTPARAVHALMCLRPDLTAALREGEYRVLRRPPGGGSAWVLDEVGLHLRLPPNGELHLVPVGKGSASGKSTGKAILGAVIVVAAVVAAIPTGGGSLALATPVLGGLTTAGSLAFFGATMFLAGVSGMLSPQATTSTSSSQAAANDSSTSLGGAQNVAVQGVPIPLVFGRAMCGSVVASIGYSAEDYATTAANTAADSIGSAPPDDTVQQGTGSGGGGKGGGTSSGAREAPNTLRSKAVVRIIDVISEGPVGGLVGGAKGIYFNGTPLQAEDGTFNFQGVTVVERTGQPDQDPVPGFPAAEQSIGLSGVQIKSGLPHTEYLNEATATAARVTIGIPALYSTDTSSGNLNPGPDVRVVVDVQAQRAGAPWVNVVTDLFTGQKCTSRYQRSYRFDLPEHGDAGVTSWAVRVSRMSPDSSTASVASDLYWDAVDVITDHQLMYPGTHYVALLFDSEAFGTTLPTRSYLTDGLQVRVPANFDPDSRTYASSGAGTAQGTWDGVSWKLSTTNDPAWCLLDVLTESRYGLGLPAAALETATYDLFTVSQYAAGVIPDGFGGAEHRYSLNIQITDADDAYAMLQQFVSAFRGMSYWAAGSMAISADMPTTPVKLVVPGNVIGGTFRYEGTSLKTRHNVARVTWRDPSQNYRQAIEVVEDYDAIASQGQREIDIQGFGITSRGLARRLGRWLLDSEKHQTQTITYAASLDHLDLRPGEVFQVTDPNYAGVRLGGRLRISASSVLHLDAVLTMNSGEVYSVSVTMPDGTLQTRVIVHFETASDGSHTIVTLNSALPVAPATNAVYLVTSASLDAPQFKVVRIVETDRGIFEVTGLEHDPGKFDRVEYDLPFQPHTYSILPALLAQPVPPPSNPTARDYLAGVGTTTIVRVTVSWTPAVNPMVRGTQVRASGPEQRLVNADGTTVDMDGLPNGSYIFSVRHTGENGRVSAWVETDLVLVDGISDAPPAVTGLTAVGGTRRISLKWNGTAIRDLLHYEVWRNNVPVLGSAGRLTVVDATTFADSDQNALQPNSTWYYWVRAVSTTLALGGWSNMAQATASYLLTDDLEAAIRNTAPVAQALLGQAPTNVDTLPGTGTDGQLVLLSTDKKVYRFDANSHSWKLFIPIIPDENGKIPASVVKDIASAVIGTSLTQDQINQVLAAVGTQSITSDQITSVVGSKVNGLLTNASLMAGRIYDVDPVSGNVIQGLDTTQLRGYVGASLIQAGSIDTSKLTTSSAANVIGNPCCQNTSWGWRANQTSGITGIQYGSVIGDGLAPAIYALPGEGSGCLRAASMAVGADMVMYWDPDFVNGVPCNPGEWWEAQGYLAAHRCVGNLSLAFNDANGNFLAAVNSERVLAGGGGELSSYHFCFIKLQAPVGAVRVNVSVHAGNDGASDYAGITPGNGPGVGPYLFFTRIVLGRSNSVTIAQGAQPQPYQIGGVTQIVAGQIKTGEVTTRHLAAGSVDTHALAVGSPTNVIWNGCVYPAAAGWSSAATPIGPGSPYALTGYGSGYINRSLAAGVYSDVWWAPQGTVVGVPYDAAIPVSPGELWEAQAKVQSHRCTAQLYLLFTGPAAGGGFEIKLSPFAGYTAAGPAGGAALADYHQLSVRGVAPAGATAVTLMLRANNDAASQALNGSASGQNAYVIWTQAGLGPALPNVPIMPWGPGGITSINGAVIQTGTVFAQQLAANSVTAAKIAAASVTTNALAAGSVTAEKAAFGSPSNIIWNSCPDQGSEGWTRFTYGSSMPQYGVDPAVIMEAAAALGIGSTWALQGLGSAFTQYQGSGLVYESQGFAWDWRPNPALLGVPVNGGKTFGAAVSLCVGGGTTALCQIIFFDGANNQVGVFSSTEVTNNATQYGGVVEAQYSRVTVTGVSPGNSGYALFRIVARGAPAGQANPFFVWTKAQFGQLPDGATAVGPWVAGGSTTIDGGMIKTRTLAANRIVAASISANELAASAVTAGKLAAGAVTAGTIAANAVTAGTLAANAVTAGTVAAAAIAADQIAGNAIHATHLAAEELLTLSAQIRYGIITTAHIQDATIQNADIANLTVGGEKIQPAAISSVAWGAAGGGSPVQSAYIGVNVSAHTNGVLVFFRTNFHGLPTDPGSSGGEGGDGGGAGDGGS